MRAQCIHDLDPATCWPCKELRRLAEVQRPAVVTAPGPRGTCAACQTSVPVAAMEPVPTQPWLTRCKDAGACLGRVRLKWPPR